MSSHKILFLIHCLVLSVCSASVIGAGSDNTVVFGGSTYYAPLYYHDHKGELKGFDIALFKAIAEEAGWRTKYEFGDWDHIQEKLAAGHIDISPMFVSPEREQRYLFSDPIMIENHILFGRRGEESQGKLGSLSGYRVAAEQGSYAVQELRRQGIDANLVETNSEAEALRLTSIGKADLALVPTHVGHYTIENERLTNLVALSPPLLPVAYAYAISPKRPELVEAANQALSKIQQNNVKRQLQNKWLSPYERINRLIALRHTLWLIVPLILVAIITAVGLWHYRDRLLKTYDRLISQESRLRTAEKRAQELSLKDELTGLPRRQFFLEYVRQALTLARNSDNMAAIAIVSLRELDYIEHAVGDRVSDELVLKISQAIKAEHTGFAGYIGQGSFTFLFENSSDLAEIISRVESLLNISSRGYEVHGILMRLRTVAGIALYPEHAQEAPELLRKGRLALRHAQEANESIMVYEPSMEPDPRNLTLMSDLKATLNNGGLSWVYQPQYCVAKDYIAGAEMLIRWQHPQHGWVPPDQFISLAEQTGIIKTVTQAVVIQAIDTLQQWHAGGRGLRLSINVSANDLADPSIVDTIIEQLRDYSGFMTLEITETAIMKDVKAIIANVERLKSANIRLALDDYGTGYSSLEYLKAFNFDEIKIDKTFIKNIAQSERDLKLAHASISLSHDLGAHVVAEGVEDLDSAKLLADMGCDILQGYGISKPLPLIDFIQFSEDFNMCFNQKDQLRP